MNLQGVPHGHILCHFGSARGLLRPSQHRRSNSELHWGPDGQELRRKQRLLGFWGLCFKIVLFRLRSLQKHAVFESSTSKLAKTKPTDHSRAESLRFSIGVTYHGEKLVLKAALREQLMPHCSL